MQLIQHHPPDPLENSGRIRPGQHHFQRFRRCHQHLGRVFALTLALGLGGITGAGLGPDIQPHFTDRDSKVAFDIHRQCLEGGDIDRVQAVLSVRGGKLNQAGQEPCHGLACSGRGHQQGGTAIPVGLHHGDLMGVDHPATGFKPRLKRGGDQAAVMKEIRHGVETGLLLS
ncbi:MAG: Uncharacterised protein [SAR116 cluster bacterium MED-G04]|nr:MAG: Uncharacterised protein [SAR116 cluster bacterium MED-G04]